MEVLLCIGELVIILFCDKSQSSDDSCDDLVSLSVYIINDIFTYTLKKGPVQEPLKINIKDYRRHFCLLIMSFERIALTDFNEKLSALSGKS